ncbi:hypothetical protein MLD38_020109 [Melastoma candidum]|uniref:Uncharacterized protein n=1 Tax=Melastoma candidum TaxID=119954 RepID=A0ACB9QC29_9MYRT|nr:hypothetical protein MLD38_020109 [Melastoma candidum]
MGKGVEEEEVSSATVVSITSERSVERGWRGCGCCCCCCGGRGEGCGIGKHVGVKCVLVLFLSAGVFLSAVFWLPPFLHFADREDLDLDPRYRGGGVAF